MIAFLNHLEQRCGVYQMGHRIAETLGSRVRYCEGPDHARAALADRPAAVVHNWHPSTLTWSREIIQRSPWAAHIGLMHEISPDATDAGSDLFPFRIVCDPLFPADGRRVFKTVRHVPRYVGSPRVNQRFTFGSFGFAVGGKMFPEIVRLVSDSFPGALVRLHIPRARFGDDDGRLAMAATQSCCEAAHSGVDVLFTHEFMSEKELLDWLAENDVNVFFYEPNGGRGVASALDYAIAVQRPIVINDSQMFRHVRDRLGYYPYRSFRDLVTHTSYVVESIYREWTPERIVQDFEQMFQALGVSA